MNKNETQMQALPRGTVAGSVATSTVPGATARRPESQTGKTEEKAGASGIEWFTKTQIARHFNCSIRHINNLMNRRILPFVKLGRFVRFDMAACDLAMKKIQTKSLFG